mmetsp:Transcript_23396/g.23025  ORF Transcript_23396/g.23025 Transcript_23396/m.23025 type:complete len:110 (-) Transcript_23396:254-583(-)
MDKEDEEDVVQDSLAEFQAMYRPIMERHFKDYAQFDQEKLLIDQNEATRKFLLSNLNDNIYQNLHRKKISVKPYDNSSKYHKEALKAQDKDNQVAEFIKENPEIDSQNK